MYMIIVYDVHNGLSISHWSIINRLSLPFDVFPIHLHSVIIVYFRDERAIHEEIVDLRYRARRRHRRKPLHIDDRNLPFTRFLEFEADTRRAYKMSGMPGERGGESDT